MDAVSLITAVVAENESIVVSDIVQDCRFGEWMGYP